MYIKNWTSMGMGENTYLLEKDGHALIIDPGCAPAPVLAELEVKELTLDAILLTHNHFDHIVSAEGIREKTGAEIWIHGLDAKALMDPALNYSAGYPGVGTLSFKADRIFEEGRLPLSQWEIEVIHTPGHTKGSCCFMIEGRLFSGDTLFRESVGRTDLQGGNYGELMKSVKKLAQLPEYIKVYPGHGSPTTLGHEVNSNPFLGENGWDLY